MHSQNYVAFYALTITAAVMFVFSLLRLDVAGMAGCLLFIVFVLWCYWHTERACWRERAGMVAIGLFSAIFLWLATVLDLRVLAVIVGFSALFLAGSLLDEFRHRSAA